ncbi:hypothetical protein CWATWH8502_3329 [Crocosphaera watsonii WH 8502]|uniref:Uncharacterized protein n=1 Tax=Crocosphaera watsonii WH 8502 TaxID=423474 RepID=T2I6Z6_CROWT|nr:hypothetical protein CWATWH8502_3329 [Crocosphaera watsonii WH 8502]
MIYEKLKIPPLRSPLRRGLGVVGGSVSTLILTTDNWLVYKNWILLFIP